MKQSKVNDKGMSATLPVEPYTSKITQTGPKSAPQEKLLAGKLASFKNAENDSAPILVSYNSPDPRRS